MPQPCRFRHRRSEATHSQRSGAVPVPDRLSSNTLESKNTPSLNAEVLCQNPVVCASHPLPAAPVPESPSNSPLESQNTPSLIAEVHESSRAVNLIQTHTREQTVHVSQTGTSEPIRVSLPALSKKPEYCCRCRSSNGNRCDKRSCHCTAYGKACTCCRNGLDCKNEFGTTYAPPVEPSGSSAEPPLHFITRHARRKICLLLLRLQG